MALRDAGAEEGTSVQRSSIRITHSQYNWDKQFFLCSKEIQKWQSMAINNKYVDPIRIEFDLENRVAKLAKC